ncbi:acylphosphatase [Virgibacillus ainsalahensis]
MKRMNVELMSNLPKDVVADISGFKLCSYLVALEGWRRGLKLTWYKDETSMCKLDRMNSSTQGKFFSLSSGTNTHYFFRSRGDKVANNTVRICQDKEKTKSLIAEKDVPVPKGGIFQMDDSKMFDYAEDIGFPVVIKPVNGSMGKGVFTNIRNKEELQNARNEFRTRFRYNELILEKHYHGKEYRIYVVGDKVIGATNRVPANIQGDGVHSIDKLIKMKNKERKNNPYLNPKPIKVDYEIKLALKNNDLEMDSILADGETLSLREKSNLSAGGDPLEATDELSKEVKQIAVDTLKALPSIPHAGVDIIVDPEAGEKGVVLEVNATAEIGFHVFPWEGKAKDVPGAIIDYYFPDTAGLKKSPFYFDYHSVIEPLRTWAANEVTIASIPEEKIYAKQFNASGKVQKVGYMNFIRRQALKNGLQGYSRKRGDKEIEIVVMGIDKQVLDKFIDICYKGSKKSKVELVKEKEVEIGDKPFKLGFEIIS